MPISMKDIKEKAVKTAVKPDKTIEQTENQDRVSERDIAIIGFAGKFASADNKEEYWQVLRRGEDCIHDYPKRRKQYGNEFLKHQIKFPSDSDYYEGGFLNETDKFDNEVFLLSGLEASLMSPEQRNFLQTAWEAMEDAGYGGNKSRGSRTGVFLGNSTDFGVPYKEFIDAQNPELSSIAISGNLNGIIASRISFFNDWKGPAIDVDTACSSSLTAIHLACKSLRDNECEMAVVGAAKIDNLPLKVIKKKEDELGITSEDGRTKTFDATSDGTGLGEGVGVIVLKKLSKAEKDGDHICAVIKGSAMNHDGQSANLTAPNPEAQEEVIIKALKDAKIKPETVSYIEAHGTGTKLGDPIEIKGITQAYRKFTDKKQFCGIGSVKSNIGHLDNAAGMAGIIKLILSLENKKLIPSIHYTKPNENINFEDSPVYVNTSFRDWVCNGSPRRCGISAFGLSGTNCHIILEEAPEIKRSEKKSEEDNYIFTISATDPDRLRNYLWKYQEYFYQHPDVEPRDLCYTVNTGRTQYNTRLAVIFQTIDELRDKLESAVIHNMSGLETQNIFYGFHKIIGDQQKNRQENELTVSERNQKTEEVSEILGKEPESVESIHRIAELFSQGAAVDWEQFYKRKAGSYQRLALPSYPYRKKSFWVETKVHKELKEELTEQNLTGHPLLHKLAVDSYDRITYVSHFSVEKDWILNEHIVAGVPVIPGTVYLEMVTAAVKESYDCETVELKDVAFLKPLSLEAPFITEVQVILRQEDGKLGFRVTSKSNEEDEWNIHAEGKVVLDVEVVQEFLDVEKIKERCPGSKLKEFAYEKGEAIELGKRWKCIDTVMAGKNEVLVHLKLQKEFQEEAAQYTMHPSLLDEAVNVPLRTIGEGIYLPFSYKSLLIMGQLPASIYSYTKWNSKEGSEVASFDVVLADENGKVLIKAEDYSIKRMHQKPWKSNQIYYQKKWIEKECQETVEPEKDIIYLIVQDKNPSSYSQKAAKVVTANCNLAINCTIEETDLETAFKPVHDYKKIHIVNLSFIMEELESFEQAEQKFERSLKGTLRILKYFSEKEKMTQIKVTEIGLNGYQITGEEAINSPYAASFHTISCAMANEFPHMSVKAVDIEEDLNEEKLLQEILSDTKDSCITAYRNGSRMIPVLDEIQEEKEEEKIIIQKNGVYVITGGTGGMGLEISRWLAEKAAINLVLLSRSGLCDSESIKQIEELGANVSVFSVDITNLRQLKEVFDKIRNEIGAVKGIIHAAGMAGDRFLFRKETSEIEAVLWPKMRGAWQLEEVCREDKLDFFVMSSSISALIPEAGQSDYAAANAFMDSFVHTMRKKGIPAFTINWPAWRETGMAVRYGVDFSKEVFEAVNNEDAEEIFFHILSNKRPNVAAGKLKYQNYRRRRGMAGISLSRKLKEKYTYRRTEQKISSEKIQSDRKIRLTGDVEYSEEEKKLAQIIGNVLGLNEVNIYNTFMQLGGNSIIAVKAEMDLEENGYEISLAELFSEMSIRDLAAKSVGDDLKESQKEKKQEKELTGCIIEGIEPFTDLIYKGCFFSAWMPALKKYNRNYLRVITNDLISFGFGDASDISSFTVHYKEISTIAQCADEMYAGLGQKMKSDDIVRDLKESITKEHPVVICIDCFYSSIRKDVFEKEHWPHNILIYGYEEQREVFYIIEHKNSGSRLYEKREMSFEDVRQAYNGYLKHFENLNIVKSNLVDLLFEDGKSFPSYFEIYPVNEKAALSNAQVLKSYLSVKKDEWQYMKDGWTQLSVFIEKLKEFVKDKEQLTEKCEDVITAINKVTNSRIVSQYRIKKLCGEKQELCDIADKVVFGWESIRNSMVKFYYSKAYRTQWVDEINKQLRQLFITEEKFYNMQEEGIRDGAK